MNENRISEPELNQEQEQASSWASWTELEILTITAINTREKFQNVTQLVVDEELAERLSLKPGDLVIRFKNIRVASEKVQETVVVTYVYIPAEAAEVLEIVKKRPEELIITLAEEVLGRECDEVKQTFSGTIMPDEVADLFKVPHGTAALKIIRNYMDVRGRTIVASESFHTADRFSFSVAVKKKKY